jgi:hypothetical protein
MATEITKTYQIEVKFTYNDGSAIAEDDLHVSELRTQIKERIKQRASWQKGNLNANAVGEVSES